MTKIVFAIAALAFLATTIVPAKQNARGTKYQCSTNWA